MSLIITWLHNIGELIEIEESITKSCERLSVVLHAFSRIGVEEVIEF